jgi:hypothetical protein
MTEFKCPRATMNDQFVTLQVNEIYEISRISKSIEAERNLEAAKSWGLRRMKINYLMRMEFLFGVMKVCIYIIFL